MATKSTAKFLFWTVVSLVGAAGLWFGVINPFMVNAQKKKDADDAQNRADKAKASGDPEAANLQQEADAIRSIGDGFPLQFGSTDAKTVGSVSKLQRWIMAKYPNNTLKAHGADDGIFGRYTQADAKTFIPPNDGTVSKDWFNTNVMGKAAPSPPDFMLSDVNGKGIYAGVADIKVFRKSDMSVVKTAAKGEYLGTVSGEFISSPNNISYWEIESGSKLVFKGPNIKLTATSGFAGQRFEPESAMYYLP